MEDNSTTNTPSKSKRRCTHEGVDDEPIRKKVANKSVGKNETNLDANNDGKKDTNLKNNEHSDPKNITVEDTVCHFDRLPQEVKEIIFLNLVNKWNNEYDPNLRLVCKSWYETCSRNKSLRFSNNKMVRRRAACLGKCGYKQLHLQFEWKKKDAKDVTDLNYIPKTVWEKVGTKIQSLQFLHCRLGDKVIKSVILCCENLKHLVVIVRSGRVAQSFCSVDALKDLKVVRPKLETLKIQNSFIKTDDPLTWNIPCIRNEMEKCWSQIFVHIIRIFPNITHFVSGKYDFPFGGKNWLKLKFQKEVDEVNKLNLISSLVHSMSANEEKWMDAINTLARMRLTAVSLHLGKSHFSQEDKASLLNFFSSQKRLKFASVSLYEADSVIEKELLRSVFLAIVNNCTELRQLKYHSGTIHLNWMNNELSHLVDLFKLNKFCTGTITFDSKRVALVYDAQCFYMPLSDWVPKYSHILHLNIEGFIPDNFLQRIFQHMISLKSFSVRLEHDNTDFAWTGRRDGTEATSFGYSINRLQKLERLDFHWDADVSDTSVFYEFDFPKLIDLSCFLPKESSTYAVIALKMPLLTRVRFDGTSKMSLDDLVNYVQLARKLHTLSLPGIELQSHEVEKIFNVCPSLRYLHTKSYIDFYDPQSKEVHRVLPKPPVIRHRILLIEKY